MHRQTRLMLATVVIAAIATLAGLAYAWYWVHRPGGGTPNNPAVRLGAVRKGQAWAHAPAVAADGRALFARRDTGDIPIIEGRALLAAPLYTLTKTAPAGERRP